MPQVVPTHINAYYRDLEAAKTEVAVAKGKVELLEQQIIAMGGELPDAEPADTPEEAKEDTVTADDVSATEKPQEDTPNKPQPTASKGKK